MAVKIPQWSVVITYYNRPTALLSAIKHWRYLPTAPEIIVCEQTPTEQSTIPSEASPDQHHHFCDPQGFSTAFLKNWGILQARTPKVMVADLEEVPFSDFPWQDTLDKVTDCQLFYMSHIRMYSKSPPEPPILTHPGVRCLPVMLATKCTWLLLGGYNPAFRGWGCEDNEYLTRTRRALRCLSYAHLNGEFLRQPCMGHIDHSAYPPTEYEQSSSFWKTKDYGALYTRNVSLVTASAGDISKNHFMGQAGQVKSGSFRYLSHYKKDFEARMSDE